MKKGVSEILEYSRYRGNESAQSRVIYFLSDRKEWKNCSIKMQSEGIRPIRYLRQLGMIVADNPNESIQLKNYPQIIYKESDIRIKITKPLVENLPNRKVQQVPWGVQRIKAPEVWPWSRGQGVRVAIVDTGISSKHPAIWANYRGGVNILSPRFAPDDYNGHGTHVAGIIAGRAEKMNILGVAPRVSIYAVKAFDRRGVANLSDLLSAIDWCIEQKVDVINMSFGMGQVSELLRYAVQKAHQRGITMVAATGNRSQKDQIDFPAQYPETIAVCSVSENGSLSSFGNLGNGVDIAAPGEKIQSAWLNQTTRVMSGTSMAVPHVVGTIALMLQFQKNLNPEQIRYLLLHATERIEGMEKIGMVNALRAMQLLQRNNRY
ncbi:Subtilase family protein [Seinonella peptonophila]|uniref:Subtilase family protein n=1 Tax=Seinonella peptonophila TaxID=112248 RepID=A0A1M4WCJ3_9BACL|nr:S8 family peptidase [Seinonella peptonophila]SHE78954.1 Subtilase family protein [Seinonella peptonophila]